MEMPDEDLKEKIFKLRLKLNDMQSNRNIYRAIVLGFILAEILRIFKIV